MTWVHRKQNELFLAMTNVLCGNKIGSFAFTIVAKVWGDQQHHIGRKKQFRHTHTQFRVWFDSAYRIAYDCDTRYTPCNIASTENWLYDSLAINFVSWFSVFLTTAKFVCTNALKKWNECVSRNTYKNQIKISGTAEKNHRNALISQKRHEKNLTSQRYQLIRFWIVFVFFIRFSYSMNNEYVHRNFIVTQRSSIQFSNRLVGSSDLLSASETNKWMNMRIGMQLKTIKHCLSRPKLPVVFVLPNIFPNIGFLIFFSHVSRWTHGTRQLKHQIDIPLQLHSAHSTVHQRIGHAERIYQYEVLLNLDTNNRPMLLLSVPPQCYHAIRFRLDRRQQIALLNYLRYALIRCYTLYTVQYNTHTYIQQSVTAPVRHPHMREPRTKLLVIFSESRAFASKCEPNCDGWNVSINFTYASRVNLSVPITAPMKATEVVSRKIVCNSGDMASYSL